MCTDDVEVTVISIKDPFGAEFEYAEGTLQPGAISQMERESQKALDDTAAVLKEANVKHDTRMEWGNAAQMLTKIASSDGYDMIVLGSRGLGGIAGLVLGSVSDQVLHRAHCPVLIVR
jgi:nucleotide-binding universal stress UspA family protein